MSKRVAFVVVSLCLMVVSFGFSANQNKAVLALGRVDVYVCNSNTQRILNAADRTGRGITAATRGVDIAWIIEGIAGAGIVAKIKAIIGTKGIAAIGLAVYYSIRFIRNASKDGRGIIISVTLLGPVPTIAWVRSQ